eukprot:scaffold32952_cov31-Attheya_sp.AAC.2
MPASLPIAMEEDGTNALLPRNSAIAISFFYCTDSRTNSTYNKTTGIMSNPVRLIAGHRRGEGSLRPDPIRFPAISLTGLLIIPVVLCM